MPQGSENPAFRRIKNPEALVTELREGDGIDPRLEHRKNQHARLKSKPNHASLRLAGQIAKCIRGSLGDGPLANFDVVGVEPAKVRSSCAWHQILFQIRLWGQYALLLTPISQAYRFGVRRPWSRGGRFRLAR